MALQRQLTVDGVEYPEAYSRIVMVRAEKIRAYIFVNTYSDLAAREREDHPIRQEEPQCDLSQLSGDLYPQAYRYLQTLPDFAQATTVPTTDDPGFVPN